MDTGVVRRYAARLLELGVAQRVPILIGVAPIPSARSARWMREKLFAIGDDFWIENDRGERVFKVVSFFLLRASGGRIGELPAGMEIEVAEARWVPLADAPRLLAYAGEREMATKAADLLEEGSS